MQPKLAATPVLGFKARDSGDLSAMIRRHLAPATSPLVMVDAVVPATGALAPVAGMWPRCGSSLAATLLLDDAHGVGVLGANGRGTLEHLGLWDAANGGEGTDGVALVAGGISGQGAG